MSKLLIVEDDFRLAMQWQSSLMKAGHAVTLAKTRQEAEGVLNHTKFDVMILDVLLEEGTTVFDDSGGISLLNSMQIATRRSQWPKTLVVSGALSTVRVGLGLEAVARSFGCDQALIKPVTDEELLAAIQRVLAQ